MTLLEKENALIERYLVIEDRHERLNAIIGHRLPERELPNGDRCDDLLVKGCASQVWLRVQKVEGKLDARFAADSVVVKGLVALLVELNHGSDVADFKQFSPRLLESLELKSMLSLTRLNGLAQVTQTFRRAADVD